MKQLRYIAYVRKSDERKERQELSIRAQQRSIKEEFPDLNIVKWMEPEERSAYVIGRPIFNQMLDLIEAGEADGIVAWYPNRLSRNELDTARVTYLLRTKLKDLKFCTYNFENSPDGIMWLQFTMNQGQYESAKQAKDVRRGMVEKAITGERPGQVAQGYLKQPVLDKDGQLQYHGKGKVVTATVNDPDRYEMVKEMWRMLLSGRYNPSQIRKHANIVWGYRAREVTSRTSKQKVSIPLSSSGIYRIFTNPFYAGWVMHNGEKYKGTHTPMISDEEFDLAQTILGSKGKPRLVKKLYAYGGLMRCGECGCSIVAKVRNKYIKSTSSYKQYTYYYCTRKSLNRPCNQRKYTSLESIEETIDDELSKVTIIPEFQKIALDVLSRMNKEDGQMKKKLLVNHSSERIRIQSKLENLIEMRAENLIDDKEYALIKKKLQSEKERLDNSTIALDTASDSWIQACEDAIDFAATARKTFNETTDLDAKTSILKGLGQNLILKDGTLTITPNPWMIPITQDYPTLEKGYLEARTNESTSPKDIEEVLKQKTDTWRARWGLNPRHPA